METAIQVLQIIFYSLASIFMIAFLVIGIWAFILYTKMYKNQRIQNYLLEKIHHAISYSTYKDKSSIKHHSSSFDIDKEIDEEELFNESQSNNDNIISL